MVEIGQKKLVFSYIAICSKFHHRSTGVLKKFQVEFPGVIKKKPCGGVLVLGLRISEGSNTILWSF